MTARATARRDGPDGEAGLTIIEVIVAALVLALGALSTFGVLAAATKNAQRARASQVALDRAQQELEALRSLKSEQLALTTLPAHAASPLDPNYRVSGGEFGTIRSDPSGSLEAMVYNGSSLYGGETVEGGAIVPGPLQFSSGNVHGKVYRYVVWRNDSNCPEDTCPGSQDYKQIIVAVKLDTPSNESGERGYVEVASDFIDPEDSSLKDPVPGSEGVAGKQQLFLSDTPCATSGTTERAEITGDHLLHNTLGTCASGMQSGTELGAPDALLLAQAPDPEPANELNPPLYDYSSDSYLEGTAETDKGTQILRDDTSGCHFDPTGTTDPESQVHRWVTDPMASEFKIGTGDATEANATLEIYTRSLNESYYHAELCVFLFKREESGSPPEAEDTLLGKQGSSKSYWQYTPGSGAFWPTEKWTSVRIPMEIDDVPYPIPAGARLGVALSFNRAGTGTEAVPIMYDHPNFPSRIEIETTTPIEGG